MSTIQVVATDGIAPEGLQPLAEDGGVELHQVPSTENGFRELLATARGLLLRSATRVTAEFLEQAPELRVVGRAGVGVDNIDLEACTRRGVAVFNAPSGNTVSAAELAFALMLASVRRVPAADRSLRAGEWARSRFKGNELRGKTLGLVGAGRIGGEVAKRARAFGMQVLVYDPYLTQLRVEELNAQAAELDELLQRADVVTLHVPLTDSTRNLIDADRLDLMKPTAHLVNTSRGGWWTKRRSPAC